jgi:regulator of protease activity HflC (stomatin/prohibitin superfamily)
VITRARLREIGRALVAWLDRYLIRITLGALVAAFLFVFLAHRIVVTIPAGHRGVLWKRFGGTVTTGTYGEGLHLVWPWNYLVSYNVRFQADTRDYQVVDSQGLQFTVHLSTRYHPNVETLGELHKRIGPGYFDVVVVPEVSSHVRGVISTMPAQDVYSRLRLEIERNILDRIRKEIDIEYSAKTKNGQANFIFVEDILLRGITLPPLVASAVEEKVRQYHMIDEWKFRREREGIEAERLRLEGRGVKNFQDEAGRSLTEQYLRLRGIDALLKLAQSPNAKTIIIGGPQGVPIILGPEGVRAAPGGPRVETPPAAGPAPASHGDGKPAAAADHAASGSREAKAAEPKPAPASGQGWLGGLVGRLLGR